MCGLVGVFGDLTLKYEKAFEDLLQIDVIRGPHSTGTALLGRDEVKPNIRKGTLLPTEIIDDNKYKDFKKKYLCLMMGHNRYATVGKITPLNAHPFQRGSITLAHNGTITSTHRLPNYLKFDTDSEAITNAIDKLGIEPVWRDLSGAAALTWWDARAETFNFITNGQRPLWFAVNADESTLIYASESWMIEAVADRRDIKLFQDKDGVSLWRPAANFLFTFKYDKDKRKLTKTTRKLENSPVYQSFRSGRATRYSAHYGAWWDDEEWEAEIVVPFTSSKEKEKEKDITVKDISEKEFHKKYKKCVFCEHPLTEEYETSAILSPYEAACESCCRIARLENISLLN